MAPPTQAEFLRAWRSRGLPGNPFDEKGNITTAARQAWAAYMEGQKPPPQPDQVAPPQPYQVAPPPPAPATTMPPQARALGYQIGGLPFQYPMPVRSDLTREAPREDQGIRSARFQYGLHGPQPEVAPPVPLPKDPEELSHIERWWPWGERDELGRKTPWEIGKIVNAIPEWVGKETGAGVAGLWDFARGAPTGTGWRERSFGERMGYRGQSLMRGYGPIEDIDQSRLRQPEESFREYMGRRGTEADVSMGGLHPAAKFGADVLPWVAAELALTRGKRMDKIIDRLAPYMARQPGFKGWAKRTLADALQPLAAQEEIALAGMRGLGWTGRKVTGMERPPAIFEQFHGPYQPPVTRVGISAATTSKVFGHFDTEKRKVRTAAQDLMASDSPEDIRLGEVAYRKIMAPSVAYLQNAMAKRGFNVTVRPNFGYFSKYLEPSMDVSAIGIRPNNQKAFMQAIVDVADVDFAQDSVLIHAKAESLKLGTTPGFYPGKTAADLDYSLEPLYALRTDGREITGRQYQTLRALADKHDIPGFAAHADNQGIDIMHVAKYGYDVSNPGEAKAAYRLFNNNVHNFRSAVDANDNVRGTFSRVEGELRQLWHYGRHENWADKAFVGRNTSSSRHGYDGFRDNLQAATGRPPAESGLPGALEKTGDLNTRQRRNLLNNRLKEFTDDPLDIPSSPYGATPIKQLEELISGVPVTAPLTKLTQRKGGRAALLEDVTPQATRKQGMINEKLGMLITEEKAAPPWSQFHKPGQKVVPGRGPKSALGVVADYTGRTVDEIEGLVNRARAEFYAETASSEPISYAAYRKLPLEKGGPAKLPPGGGSPEVDAVDDLLGFPRGPIGAGKDVSPGTLKRPEITPRQQRDNQWITDMAEDLVSRDQHMEWLAKGMKMGGGDWYNTDFLRKVFVAIAEDESTGNDLFREYINLVAATSPGNQVKHNLRVASWYRKLLGDEGLKMPATPWKELDTATELAARIADVSHPGMPKLGTGYGHPKWQTHAKLVAKWIAGKWNSPVSADEKVRAFANSLLGNPTNVAVDVHLMRFLGMTSIKAGRDPVPWLKTGYQDISKKDLNRIIKNMKRPDGTPLKDALTSLKKRKLLRGEPGAYEFDAKSAVKKKAISLASGDEGEELWRIQSIWNDAPGSSARYQLIEDYVNSLARQWNEANPGNVITAPQAQASLWVAAADLTGVKEGGRGTVLSALREVIAERAAAETKRLKRPVSEEMVLHDFLQNRGLLSFLVALGGGTMAAEAYLGEAGEEDARGVAPGEGMPLPGAGEPGVEVLRGSMAPVALTKVIKKFFGNIFEAVPQVLRALDTGVDPVMRQFEVPPPELGKLSRAGDEELRDLGIALRTAQDTEAATPPLRQYVYQTEETMGRILRDTVPGETPEQSLISAYEGATKIFDNDAKVMLAEKKKILLSLGVGTTERARWVPRPEDRAGLITLFRALHDKKYIRNIAPIYRPFYKELKELVGKEEALRIDFDPNLATIDDYFFRGWKPPDNLLKAAEKTGGSVGNIPGFTLPRNGATFDEMVNAGFEPLYWNPWEMYVETARMGNRYRLQTQLINDFRNKNAFDVFVVKKEDRLLENGDWIIDNLRKKGYRIPRIGPAFEGRAAPMTAQGATGRTHAGVIVPNGIADRLENVFGRRPKWKGFWGKDIYPYVFAITYQPKRIKLYASLFQQRDFMQRAYGSSWTSMIDEMKHGNYGTGIIKLAKFPKEGMWDIVRSNLDPKYRDDILKWYTRTDEIIAGRPGINPREMVRAGLSTIDVTLMPADMDNLARVAAQATGKRLDKKMLRAIGEFESMMRRGLFEGVYPTAMRMDIINNIAPMFVRMFPGLTDQQLNGMIARAANIRYSTIPASQSVIQKPWLRETLKLFFFSLGESEGLIRQATKSIRGPDAKYWRKSMLGTYLSMVATADVIHYATTGKHLPVDRFIPVDFDPEWEFEADQIGHWLNKPTPFGYQRDFAAPDIPVTDRTGEQQLTLDLMGQMDTVLKMSSPGSWVVSRRSVPITAIAHAVTNKDFYDRLIRQPNASFMDQSVATTAQLINDMGVPIGAGQSALQLAREYVPGAEKIIPQEGARLGTTAQILKGVGALVRSPVTADLRDLMVRKVAEGDPEAVGQGIEPGMKWDNLTYASQNYVMESPLNKGLMEEVELRGEEQALSVGDPINVFYTEQKERRDAHFSELSTLAERAETKINKHGWYREHAAKINYDYSILRQEYIKQAKEEFGDDFMDRARKGLTPQQQLEEDFFGLLYSDDIDVYGKYFPGEEFVPLDNEDGDFNSVEYERRIQALNTEAGDPNFVRNMRDAILDRKVQQGLPELERERLQDRDYISENYWRASTNETLLALLPSDEVREAWINYVAMSDANKKEEDGRVGSVAGKRHRVGVLLITFREMYNSAGIRKVRREARQTDNRLEDMLLKWGYVDVPVEEYSIAERARGARSRVPAGGPWGR